MHMHQPSHACRHSSWRLLQARVRAINEIVQALVTGIREGHDVDLNDIKRRVRMLCFVKPAGSLTVPFPDVHSDSCSPGGLPEWLSRLAL